MARRKVPKGEAQLAFEALSIEGGLLAPEWLSRVAQLGAAHQSEPDYRIPKGLNLRDEIGRYWRIAQAHWGDFSKGRAAGAEPGALAQRFVLGILRESFAFGSLGAVAPVELDGRAYPVGFSALGRRVPVVIAPAGSGLDTLAASFADETRRRSAFGLVQEYLNADEGARWGIVSDGLSLRIARDNASLTRPAWIEADLGRMFTEERFADFAALWLLAHETRFGEVDQAVTECALETWREAGRQQGTRAREHLRDGVELALIAVGQGFLAHPENQALRSALQSGELTTKDYFNQLLRLVYRVIFLLTVEERGLLHHDGADAQAKALYADGYSLKRLRERSVKRSAHDRFSDLWEATKIVFGGLVAGEHRLALPALAGIFAKTQCPTLDASKLENRALLTAIFRLSWIREHSSLSRVNWRDMGPEELGSVYESLLELVPQITKDGRQFAFATGAETKGNARKTSGSYYTPDSLVQVLLDSALEPVVESTVAANPEKAVEALLQLSIVDPACGSGHFLLAAARRLAAHVARLQANGTPSAAEYRHALRQVIGRCIYGVDLNPMAVELCKVSLWMEAVEPGLPLTFLNSHVRQGNALVGTTVGVMAHGIPDAAWDPIEGDDKKIASALKKRNKKAAEGQRGFDTLWSNPSEADAQALARAMADLDAVSDASPEALAKKESQWAGLLGSSAFMHQKLVADAWCAAFVWPKQPGKLAEVAPTNDLWRQVRDRQGEPPTLMVKTVADLADRYHFFHWDLAFPQVFARGGFDVALGNPPWDRVTFEEREWFAGRSPEIAEATTAGKRRALLARLAEVDPELHASFLDARRGTSGIAGFCGGSTRFLLTAVGHFNTYALFTELAASALISGTGRAGLLSPTAVVTGDYSKALTRALLQSGRLLAVFDFDNRAKFFPMQPNIRFALVVVAGAKGSTASSTRVASQLRSVRELDDRRVCRLAPAEVLAMNPETATIPFFYSARDADLVSAMYRRRPSLFDATGGSSWSVDFGRMLNMSDDSEGFVTLEELPEESDLRQALLPVYEAKLTGQYDHRASTFEGVPREDRFRLHAGTREPTPRQKGDPEYSTLPRYWLPASAVAGDLGDERYFLAYRDAISATADARSLAACVIPRAPSVHTLLLVRTDVVLDAVVFAAAMNSFVLDYVLRQKATGGHAARFILRQLPFINRSDLDKAFTWGSGSFVVDWLVPRVLELSFTAWDLEHFAQDLGCSGPPFRWDEMRRLVLRCELDAAFLHVYGLSRDDADYVMNTFPIVRRRDEEAHGEYRTKRVILEIYDAMIEAARTATPYQTRLDPPPADPRVGHPDTRGGKR